MALPALETLRRCRKDGDAAADAVIATLAKTHPALVLGALLERLFRWGPAAPFPTGSAGVPQSALAAAQAFICAPDPLKDAFAGEAVDWVKVRQAQELFTQSLFSGLLVLGCASLPACYGHPGVALVLMGSGRLAIQVRRRLKETIAFLTLVMQPGSLNEGAALGAVWIRKVRFLHALMRWLANASGAGYEGLTDDKPSNVLLKLNWQRPEAPINQVELAYVLLTFSWLLVRGFGRLRVRMTAAQRDAHIYTWAVIGHGLGIHEALRPRGARDAQTLFERIRDEFERGTEEGRLLTAALVVYVVMRQREAISEFLPWLRRPGLRWLVNLVRPFAEACLESLARTLVRDLAGVPTANRLWVPRAPFVHWVVGNLMRAFMTALELRSGQPETGLPRILGRKLEPV